MKQLTDLPTNSRFRRRLSRSSRPSLLRRQLKAELSQNSLMIFSSVRQPLYSDHYIIALEKVNRFACSFRAVNEPIIETQVETYPPPQYNFASKHRKDRRPSSSSRERSSPDRVERRDIVEVTIVSALGGSRTAAMP